MNSREPRIASPSSASVTTTHCRTTTLTSSSFQTACSRDGLDSSPIRHIFRRPKPLERCRRLISRLRSLSPLRRTDSETNSLLTGQPSEGIMASYNMSRNASMDPLPLTEPVLLVLLSLAEQPRHGYSILKDVEHMSSGRVVLSTGTLYGALQRLLSQGWIERFEEDQIGRAHV